jgi:hypothetical protein
MSTTGNMDCYMQESSWACGLACIAMILNRQGHGHPTANAIAAASQNHGGAYVSAISDRPGAQSLIPRDRKLATSLISALAKRRKAINPGDNPLADGTPSDVLDSLGEGDSPGMTPFNIVATLQRQYRIKTARYVDVPQGQLGPLKDLMDNASAGHPVILCLTATPHFVLCEGLLQGSSNRYVFVDPEDGLRYTDGELGGKGYLKFNGKKYISQVDEAIVS